MTATPEPQPGPECPLCPRLAAFRDDNRRQFADWHNAPVSSFGNKDCRLLIVGLAPGLRGANRTGRPFTGDYAGDLLYATLSAHGFVAGTYDRHADDGLALVETRITNAVRCVPPENKPTTTEIATCLPFLSAEIASLPRLQVILALGAIAHGAVLMAVGLRKSAFRFQHGGEHDLPAGLRLIDSYHCSRYNTNTGRLTPAMFDSVISRARALTAG